MVREGRQLLLTDVKAIPPHDKHVVASWPELITFITLLRLNPTSDSLSCTPNARLENVFSIVLYPIQTMLWQFLKIVHEFWSGRICIS